jgi:hypothetical protein
MLSAARKGGAFQQMEANVSDNADEPTKAPGVLESLKAEIARWPDFAEMARKESDALAAVITAGITAHRSRSNGQVSPIDFANIIGSTIEIAEAVCNTLGKLSDDELGREETSALATAILAERERILQARPPKPVTF